MVAVATDRCGDVSNWVARSISRVVARLPNSNNSTGTSARSIPASRKARRSSRRAGGSPSEMGAMPAGLACGDDDRDCRKEAGNRGQIQRWSDYPPRPPSRPPATDPQPRRGCHPPFRARTPSPAPKTGSAKPATHPWPEIVGPGTSKRSHAAHRPAIPSPPHRSLRSPPQCPDSHRTRSVPVGAGRSPIGPPMSFIAPIRASLTPSITPSAAADAPSVPVRKAGSTDVVTS